MTTADYLDQLQQDREDLVDNLEAKGITGLSGDETFTELVPEVLNITSHTGAYKVSSVAEMNAIDDMQTGDYCIIETPMLPLTFQEVEYIQSTGANYIDTNYQPYKTTLDIKFSIPTEPPSDAKAYLAGVRESSPMRRYYPLVYDNESGYLTSYDNDNNAIILGNYDSNIHTLVFNGNNNKVYYDNVEKGTVSDLLAFTKSLYLFGFNNNGVVRELIAGRIYNAKILEDGILVKTFIPCYRKNDNVIGMYDTINDIFYTSQGAGNFIKGDSKTTYIYSVYQYINNEWVQV